MFTDIKELIQVIDDCEKVYVSELDDWDLKYDLIFGKAPLVRNYCDLLGIHFDYYDPDTSYEEDVRAYMEALIKLKNKLVILVKE